MMLTPPDEMLTDDVLEIKRLRKNLPKEPRIPCSSRWLAPDQVNDVSTPSPILTQRPNSHPLLQLDQTAPATSRPTAPSCRFATPAATLRAESSSNAHAISTKRMSAARAGSSSMSRARPRPTSADIVCAADEQHDTFRRLTLYHE